ncbi:MAG: serine/threonine protein kinase, partial [Chloroflexales bacterium]|nr:serine/threonine protein kinase [Chloroflexales bacterium]
MTDRILNSTLGQYDVIEVLGHGGMATVYKAYQPSLGRFVAIKVLQHYHNAEYIARFKSEARSLALLQHPNILPVHDYGEQSGVLYLVLQLVPGGLSLANLVGQAHPPEKVGPLMLRLLAGLEYAHAQGIVHRDIKPANILMPAPDWPMLSDFGLSKFLSDSSPHLTVPGTIMGTVGYMPPEQATAQVIDARSDIYSTGVVLYQLLTGRLPFDGDTPMEVLVKHAYAPPPPPRQINPSIPAPIEQVILRAMAKSPADRYQTAAQMAAELKRIIERPPGPEFADPLGTIRMPIAPPQPADPPAPSADNPSRARSWAPPVIVALVLALILALAGGAVLLLWPRPAPPSVAAVATGVAPSLAAATSASATTVPATQPPATAATGAVAVAGGATPSGAVSYSDAGLWSDTVTLSVRGLPDVSAEQVYAAWLSNASGSLYVGDLQRHAGDDLRVSYTSPIHQNLIGEYDQIFIAHVPKSAAAAEVANVVLSGALPGVPLIHLRHDLVSYSSTPGNIGYLLGLERELAEALVHAERLVK